MKTRRSFIASLLGLSGFVAASVGWWWFSGGGRRLGLREPATVLREAFAYLDVEPGALEAYVADWEARRGPLRPSTRLNDDFYTRFLLSTDHFHRPPESREPIQYIAWYDPYERPCANPFAQFTDA